MNDDFNGLPVDVELIVTKASSYDPGIGSCNFCYVQMPHHVYVVKGQALQVRFCLRCMASLLKQVKEA